jgi:hypothetical protein
LWRWRRPSAACGRTARRQRVLEIVVVVAVQRTRADHQWPRNPSLSKMGWDTKKPFSGVAWAENCFTCGYAAAHQSKTNTHAVHARHATTHGYIKWDQGSSACYTGMATTIQAASVSVPRAANTPARAQDTTVCTAATAPSLSPALKLPAVTSLTIAAPLALAMRNSSRANRLPTKKARAMRVWACNHDTHQCVTNQYRPRVGHVGEGAQVTRKRAVSSGGCGGCTQGGTSTTTAKQFWHPLTPKHGEDRDDGCTNDAAAGI